MGREIKFRGLQTDGKGWVYGNLIKTESGQCYIFNFHFIPALSVPSEKFVEIIPETVGQFVGITKEKNELYEGDIVMNGESIRFIEFRWSNFVATTPEKTETLLLSLVANPKAIGNIHENPELIK